MIPFWGLRELPLTHQKHLIYSILVNGFLFITIFAKKNGLSENMISDWMLFLELTFKYNSDH